MIAVEQVFGLGAAGMCLGTAGFLWGARSVEGDERIFYWLLAAISGIAAVAYLLMTAGIGWLTVGERTVFAPRYVDWILTTPLLLIALGLLAGIDRERHLQVVGVNTAVMIVGFGAALLESSVRFVAFGVAAVAFLVLAYLLLGPVTDSASRRPPGVESLFLSLRNLTVVLWSVYPAVWLLGPPGLDVLTLTADVMLVVYLDLLTKVGFGLIGIAAGRTIEAEFGEDVGEVVETSVEEVADAA